MRRVVAAMVKRLKGYEDMVREDCAPTRSIGPSSAHFGTTPLRDYSSIASVTSPSQALAIRACFLSPESIPSPSHGVQSD